MLQQTYQAVKGLQSTTGILPPVVADFKTSHFLPYCPHYEDVNGP